ncbi:alpha/beta hydrolase [Actinoplanes sp. NPDC024001]|uniref:alpha/beta fold hydrolase n=1 Tax=Actinoplanes sp. NPDC024001 TaxID=3154598 RepID=UPI0033C9BD13
MTPAREGTLAGGLPYRAAGTGPPVIVLPGISGDNADPTGGDRRSQLRAFRALTGQFTVYVINRRPGLAAGATIRDMADDYAYALTREFGEPVAVIGVSTGGSVAQMLAADHPHLVSRLVLVASAHRLAERGRRAQRALARHAEAGRPRRAWASMAPALAHRAPGRWGFTALLWLLGARMTPADPADLLITIAAEDGFDAWPDLPRITAPTLIVGGARDGFYSPQLFRETADRIPDGRLLLHRRKGHAGTSAGAATVREIRRFLTP